MSSHGTTTSKAHLQLVRTIDYIFITSISFGQVKAAYQLWLVCHDLCHLSHLR